VKPIEPLTGNETIQGKGPGSTFAKLNEMILVINTILKVVGIPGEPEGRE